MNDMQTKPAVSITEMAKMVGLSYQRFSQLRKACVFPEPLYDVESKRPYYSEEQQKVCLLVRKRNMGINGKAIMFYSQRTSANAPVTPRPRKRKKVQPNKHAALIESLKSLGLSDLKPQQVDAAVRELYPSGTQDEDQTEVVRAVFVHMMQKNCGS